MIVKAITYIDNGVDDNNRRHPKVHICGESTKQKALCGHDRVTLGEFVVSIDPEHQQKIHGAAICFDCIEKFAKINGVRWQRAEDSD